MPRPVTEIQDGIAQAIADAMEQPWERIVCNYEVSHDDADGPANSYIFFPVVRSADGELMIEDDMDLPDAASRGFMELNDALFATTGSRWGICDLLIEGDGSYAFTFDYGPAKRLNGVLDEASHDRFDTYLDTYRAELASAGKA